MELDCAQKHQENPCQNIAAALKLDFEGSLHKQEEPMVNYAEYNLRSRARKSKIKACVWYQCREAQSKEIRYELNKEQKLLSLSVVCNEIHLRHEKGLNTMCSSQEKICVCAKT